MKKTKYVFVLSTIIAIGAQARQQRVRCESMSDRYTECSVGGRIRDMRLEQQLSHASCSEGRSYGIAGRESIYVDRGCRAVFIVEVNDGWGGGGGGGGWGSGRDFNVRCESFGGSYKECDTGVIIRRVELYRQISGTACIEGRNWTYDRRVIKVKDGCRADFRVSGR